MEIGRYRLVIYVEIFVIARCASNRIRYETTGSRRRSYHLIEIGTIAIQPLTLHDFISCDWVFSCNQP